MKDVRFYLEFPDAKTKRASGTANKGHSGNVFAAFVGNRTTGSDGDAQWEGLGAVFETPNSPVAGTSASIQRWIWPECKRISEQAARRIHPALFERLDWDEGEQEGR